MKPVDSSPESSPRVLIVTLHSGEQELAAGTESIERQTMCGVEQIVISGLPNLPAHRALYRTITEKSKDFDFFVKLDADMVFRSTTSLANLLEAFRDPDLDHLVAPVFDVPSGSNIHGIHLYRAGVRWGSYQDAMFVDPNPIIKGKRVILDVNTVAEVEHMPNPSDEQAFLFGVHRAVKIVQRDRFLKEWKNAKFQIDLLSRIASVIDAKHGNRKNRKMILLGAEWVFGGDFMLLEKKEGALFRHYIAKSLTASAKRETDFPAQRWLPGSRLLAWRRFRYIRFAALYSLPSTFILRSAYRIYVRLGIRALVRRGIE